jgi:hypothetical protein
MAPASRASHDMWECVLTDVTECSAMKNRGVNEAFTEAARVALTVKNVKGDKDSASCSVM